METLNQNQRKEYLRHKLPSKHPEAPGGEFIKALGWIAINISDLEYWIANAISYLRDDTTLAQARVMHSSFTEKTETLQHVFYDVVKDTALFRMFDLLMTKIINLYDHQTEILRSQWWGNADPFCISRIYFVSANPSSGRMNFEFNRGPRLDELLTLNENIADVTDDLFIFLHHDVQAYKEGSGW